MSELPGWPLTDLTIYGDQITEWEYVDTAADSDTGVGRVRLYYTPRREEEMAGFDFCAVEVDTILNNTTLFADESTRVSILMWGRAHWDGMTHVQFGSEQTNNRGYIHGRPFDTLRAIFADLERLETEHCRASNNE